MKKLFMAALAVCAFSFSNAQETSFGVKAGVNFATITGDFTDGIESRTSFHIGGVAELMLSEKFSIQPELVYSAQGAKEENGDGELKYDYLNLPILAKYYIADGFSIEAGPQIGFLLSANAEDGSTEVDVKDETTGVDFGLGFGLGYKLDSGLNFAARYNLGLSNTNDFDGADMVDQKNGVVQLSVGFMF